MNILIHQYESLLLSDISDNAFPNVILDDIEKLLPLLGG